MTILYTNHEGQESFHFKIRTAMFLFKGHKLFVGISVLALLILSYHMLIGKTGKDSHDEYYKKIDNARVTTTGSGEDEEVTNKKLSISPSKLNTGGVTPADVVNYAQTLIGVPYKYGSVDPNKGFDCSGYITYVYNHFNIAVPRSSIDFTTVGKEIPLAEAKSSDIILFTGTDSSDGKVGHMGIVVSNNKDLDFIHSTSGKAKGVTITRLNEYYMSRFVKIIRIFGQNEEEIK